jgi:hypothetical protein
MKKEKTLEAMLVITTGMLLIYLIKQEYVFLYISLACGLTGIFIKPLASLIAFGWYKTGDLLGFVVSKIVLTLIFFFFLLPVALLFRFFHKDPLHLKKPGQSNWSIREHTYSEKDMINIW